MGVALRWLCVVTAIMLVGMTGAVAQFQASDSDEFDDEQIDQLNADGEEREAGGDSSSDTKGESWLSHIPFLKSPLLELPDLPLPKLPKLGDTLVDTLRYGYGSKIVYFGGVDLWRAGITSYGGLFYSANGANVDGFIFKGLIAEGVYAYRSGRRIVRGFYSLASVMPGWRLSSGSFDIKAYAGLDLQYHRTLPNDPGNRLRGSHAGLRTGIDAWWEPFPRVVMTAASLSASSIGHSYRVRLASGARIADWFWLGPEAEIGHDDVYRQYRIGAHLTGFRFARLDWSLAGGYLTDNSGRSGAYGRLGIAARLHPGEIGRFAPF